MSYSAIITFKDGKADQTIEFGNSWKGAAYIWDQLFNKYMKDPNDPYDSWLLRGIKGIDKLKPFWQLCERKDLPMFERSVHASTMDKALVFKKDFKQFIEHLREFDKIYPGNSHLNDWVNFIETCEADAIGFMGTSVSGTNWFTETENGETIPYDLTKQTDHYDLYEDLAEWDKEN